MEPLTTGAIALLLFCGEKLIDWGINKAYDVAFDKLMEKSPNTAKKLELPPEEREDIGEALLVEMVENTAENEPELQKAFNQLAQKVKEQNSKIVNENWQGINIKGGTNTVQNNTFNFGK